MKAFNHKSELIIFLDSERARGMKIGLVPTMGALHEGHLALIRASKQEADITVCSIFVNPKQFNNKQDLLKYPKTFKDDIAKLKKEGCEVIYSPLEGDIFDESHKMILSFNFGELETVLEGKYRPGHFKGVAIVVTKLFNIVQPHFTYFGQKDLQQFFLIENIIHDLSYRIQLRRVPTIREKDGLALSSRNMRITEDIRPLAKIFYECLTSARNMLHSGADISNVKKYVNNVFSKYAQLQLEYFEIIDTRKFTITDTILDKNKTALCIAGYLNNIRLIDNVMYI